MPSIFNWSLKRIIIIHVLIYCKIPLTGRFHIFKYISQRAHTIYILSQNVMLSLITSQDSPFFFHYIPIPFHLYIFFYYYNDHIQRHIIQRHPFFVMINDYWSITKKNHPSDIYSWSTAVVYCVEVFMIHDFVIVKENLRQGMYTKKK